MQSDQFGHFDGLKVKYPKLNKWKLILNSAPYFSK